MLLVGVLAGIGFTMAIFVAGLAFEDTASLDAAKIAVLAASLVAGASGSVIGRRTLRAPSDFVASVTLPDARSSRFCI